MAFKKSVPVRNQGTIEIEVRKSDILLTIVSGQYKVVLDIPPGVFAEIVDISERALCYFDGVAENVDRSS